MILDKKGEHLPLNNRSVASYLEITLSPYSHFYFSFYRFLHYLEGIHLEIPRQMINALSLDFP